MGKMSAKRRPGNELTHDNWDDEEDQEEQGEFRKASEAEMKQRTIKVAKRRVPRASGAVGGEDSADGGESTAAAPATGVFSGFSGFGSAAATKSASSPFAFLSSGSGGASSAATASPFASISFGSKPTTTTTTDKLNNGKELASSSPTKPKANDDPVPNTPEKSSAYYAKLKGLNQSVSAWISKHVSDNPLCKLTPIFDDYGKFLKDIEQLDEGKASSATSIKTPDYTFSSAAATSSKTTEGNVPTKIAFGAPSSTSDAKSVFQMPSFGTSPSSSTTKPPSSAATSSAPSTSTFSFGSIPVTATAPSSTSTFSFGSVIPAPASSSSSSSSAAATSTGFSFGGFGASSTSTSTPFSFSNVAGPSTSSSGAPTVDNDDEEPPKNEFTPVVEEDSLFTKRCKIFVKTGGEFVDRGVGQLFIKSADDGKKTQMLVRADTNLGNILLNILLTEAVPASRMGKNNVMMICIPTPDAKPPPATVLVRVKNAEEADELLEQIEKHKK